MNYTYLLIEFIDELVFGVGETAWPLIRDDLNLTYSQIGLLLSLPGIIAAFMLVPGFIPKLILVILVNLFNTGWYPILQGRLYSSLPGQSASIMAIGAVTTPLAKALPLLIGILASAMWILLLGPIALLIGLPKNLTPRT